MHAVISISYLHWVSISISNTSVLESVLVMIRYQDFNFDTISIRYFENIAISIFLK